MSQPMPADRKALAMYHLDMARAALRRPEPALDEGLFHATQALRLADNDTKIQAVANVLSGLCHERQDHYHLAYYAFEAAKGQDPKRWTNELEESLQFCRCKIFPR